MALPRKLKHLNLFNDGNNWQGIVESLTLPKFTRKYEKYRGGGMPGAVDVDLGLDDSALDTEFFHWSVLNCCCLNRWVKPRWMASSCALPALFSVTIPGKCRPVELVVRGRHKEVDSGEWKTGESNTTKVTSTNSYAKLTINGEVLYESGPYQHGGNCGRCGPDGSAPQRPRPLIYLNGAGYRARTQLTGQQNER